MRLEFRIPISPRPRFFAQVRFFNFALRRKRVVRGHMAHLPPPSAIDIRVLHYLRGDEIKPHAILQLNEIDAFLERNLTNPANILLQDLARRYRPAVEAGAA